MNPLLSWAAKRPELLLPVFFLSLFLHSYGQSPMIDARERALGNIYSVGTNSIPVSLNPGALGNVKSHNYNISHARPYLVRDLGLSSLSVCLPTGRGSFRLGAATLGINHFNIYNWSIDYGLRLSNSLSAGVTFSYSNIAVNGEWNYSWRINPGLGIDFRPSEKSSIGILINNPFTIGNQPGYGPLEPSLLALGASYEIYKATWCLVEVAMSSKGNICLKGALEYVMKSGPALRGGFSTDPYMLTFGSAYKLGNVMTDVGFCYTGFRGFTPSITLRYFPDR